MPSRARRGGAFVAVALALTSVVACKREATSTAPAASAAPAVASAKPFANENPFVRSFPNATAIVTYAKKDGSLKEVFHLKGGRLRTETVAGVFADGVYSVIDSDFELRVLPKEKKVRRFRAPESHLFEAYRALAPAEQARVQRSVAVVGPDLPWYVERSPKRIADRDVQGVHASCYRMTSRVLGTESEYCYWHGITVYMKEKNPIDDREMEGEATQIALDVPVDDALFAIPADFARVDEERVIADTMQGVYAKLVGRMASEAFRVEHLDRFAPTP